VAAGLYRAGAASYNLVAPRLACKALERLEPCAGRLARTVLRGEGRRNAPFLPGSQTSSKEKILVWEKIYKNDLLKIMLSSCLPSKAIGQN